MKINLTTATGRKEIGNVRSQIGDAASLKRFDDFVARNSSFDFDNDEHIASLRQGKQDCHCTVTTTVPVNV